MGNCWNCSKKTETFRKLKFIFKKRIEWLWFSKYLSWIPGPTDTNWLFIQKNQVSYIIIHYPNAAIRQNGQHQCCEKFGQWHAWWIRECGLWMQSPTWTSCLFSFFLVFLDWVLFHTTFLFAWELRILNSKDDCSIFKCFLCLEKRCGDDYSLVNVF